MATLEELTAKYRPVLDELADEHAKMDSLEMIGQQLHIKATVVSTASKDRVWDVIKEVDPTYSDLKHKITVGDVLYTVQQGDTLSKLSLMFYGRASDYTRIASANKVSDPNKIKAGQTLTIPAVPDNA